MFKKPKFAIGVHIGDSFMQLLELRIESSKVSIHHYVKAPLPQNKDRLLQDWLTALDVRVKSFCIALPMERVNFKKIKNLPTNHKKRNAILLKNIPLYFPEWNEDIIYDCIYTEDQTYLIIATPLAFLRNFLNTFKNISWVVKRIDLESYALLRALQFTFGVTIKSFLVIFSENNYFTIFLVNNNMLIHEVKLPFENLLAEVQVLLSHNDALPLFVSGDRTRFFDIHALLHHHFKLNSLYVNPFENLSQNVACEEFSMQSHTVLGLALGDLLLC